MFFCVTIFHFFDLIQNKFSIEQRDRVADEMMQILFDIEATQRNAMAKNNNDMKTQLTIHDAYMDCERAKVMADQLFAESPDYAKENWRAIIKAAGFIGVFETVSKVEAVSQKRQGMFFFSNLFNFIFVLLFDW